MCLSESKPKSEVDFLEDPGYADFTLEESDDDLA